MRSLALQHFKQVTLFAMTTYRVGQWLRPSAAWFPVCDSLLDVSPADVTVTG